MFASIYGRRPFTATHTVTHTYILLQIAFLHMQHLLVCEARKEWLVLVKPQALQPHRHICRKKQVCVWGGGGCACARRVSYKGECTDQHHQVSCTHTLIYTQQSTHKYKSTYDTVTLIPPPPPPPPPPHTPGLAMMATLTAEERTHRQDGRR